MAREREDKEKEVQQLMGEKGEAGLKLLEIETEL